MIKLNAVSGTWQKKDGPAYFVDLLNSLFVA
jgi:hypothetical protein